MVAEKNKYVKEIHFLHIKYYIIATRSDYIVFVHIHHRRQLHIRWYDKNVEGGSEAWKPRSLKSVGQEQPLPLSSQLWDLGSAVSSPVVSGTEPQPKSNWVYLKQKKFLAAFCWASHENSERRQRQFSIKSMYVFTAFDFPVQCSDACLEQWSLTARKLHARPQPDSGQYIIGTKVATERQLWREITSRQSYRTHKRLLSVTRCLLPAMTLVSDNSDDKPWHLTLCVNSLSICLSYEPCGIASVTGYC